MRPGVTLKISCFPLAALFWPFRLRSVMENVAQHHDSRLSNDANSCRHAEERACRLEALGNPSVVPKRAKRMRSLLNEIGLIVYSSNSSKSQKNCAKGGLII